MNKTDLIFDFSYVQFLFDLDKWKYCGFPSKRKLHRKRQKNGYFSTFRTSILSISSLCIIICILVKITRILFYISIFWLSWNVDKNPFYLTVKSLRLFSAFMLGKTKSVLESQINLENSLWSFFKIDLVFLQLRGKGRGNWIQWVFIYSNFWQNLWKSEIEIQKKRPERIF